MKNVYEYIAEIEKSEVESVSQKWTLTPFLSYGGALEQSTTHT